MTGKRIAFILYDYPLGVSTMIINTIALLRKDNEIAIFLNDDQYQKIPCEPWLQDLIVPLVPGVQFADGMFNGIFKFIDRLRNSLVWRLCDLFSLPWETRYWRLARFAQTLRHKFNTVRYDIIVPVEALSLIAVAQAGAGDADVVYFDMELLDWGTNNPLYADKLELKKRQHKALEQVDHVMITSPERAKIFAQINKFDPGRISVLPVVPLKRIFKERSRYFRERFSIPKDAFIVVYAGNFMPWAQCVEIIKSMESWPKNAVLVMHTWNKASLKSEYFCLMQKASVGRPVFFSSHYFLHDDLVSALTSADVGLIFYESIDSNFTEVCFSSNKMAEYVAAGLPVIASPFPTMKGFIETQGIGKAVPFIEIGDAIREIFQSKDVYQKKVKECADTLFCFEDYFVAAWARYERTLNNV
jgi:glycosyltransferase involved in cell wall biosynthesis